VSRPVAALLFVIAVFAALVAYNDGASHDRNGVVQITYWTGWTGREFDVQKKLVEEFNRTHARVNVRMISVGSYGGVNQKVKVALSTGAVPDVCSAVWSHELAGYAFRGVLDPLDTYMAKSGRRGDEFMPGIWKSLNYKGRPYALCATTNSLFVAYNKKVFRECGLDPNRPPRTIAELDRAVAAVTKSDSRGDYVRYGFRPTWLEGWAYAFGGQWYDEKTGRITANDPRNVRCLRWMASYSKKYDVRRMMAFEQTFGSAQSANGSFFTGKQIMLVTGEWIQQFVDRYARNLEWGFFPFPCPPGGRRDYTSVSGSVFVIPAASKRKRAAWEFLNWICGPYAVKRFCLSVGNLPPLESVAAQPEFQKDPVVRFALSLTGGRNAIGAVPIPIWANYQNEILRAEDYAVTGGQDPKRLLDDLTVKIQRELDRVTKGR